MPMLNMTYNRDDIIRLIVNDLANKTGMDIPSKDIRIMVKSQQNYKSEWESADFKAEIQADLK